MRADRCLPLGRWRRKSKQKHVFCNIQKIYYLQSTYETGENEPRIEMMLGKRKHRHTNVGENEILRQEIEQLEDLLSALSRVVRQIVVRVVGLADAAKEHGHDARQFGHFGNQERAVGHEHKEGRLENREIANARELGQVLVEREREIGRELRKDMRLNSTNAIQKTINFAKRISML